MKQLEIKRSIMLMHGIKAPDHVLDEMKLSQSENGNFVIKFRAVVRTTGWKMQYGSAKQ